MKTRPLIIAKLEEFVRNKLINLKSMRLLQELRTFVWNNGRPEAMRGYNDDLVMSLAIACWIRDTALVKSKKDRDYNKAMLDALFVSNTKLNTQIKGMDGYNKKEDFISTMVEEKKNQKEFFWIYKG
jgi:hypothetical protein